MPYPLPLATLGALLSDNEPVVLLDSARPTATESRSLLFLHPREILTAPDRTAVDGLLEGLARRERRHWLAGYLHYEAAHAWHPRLRTASPATGPVAWFGVYERPYVFDHREGRWDRPPPGLQAESTLPRSAARPRFRAAIDQIHYRHCLAAIHRYLERGDTYQVNLTFDGELLSTLDAWTLYRRLRTAQAVPYSAFIRHGDTCILSFSPELFFRTAGGRIVTRPMKGTATRGVTVEQDQVQRLQLAADPKNRAENLMIVDLLRNDLGRICEAGTIEVPQLFHVEAHRTVLQMTSTVTGTLRPRTGLTEILRALFPCGSVTGAPKLRTMEIIAELETGPRGVYCGALGYSAPDGDRTFSVPIRTLQRHGQGPWRYRVGSGIVWDSDPEAEWRECLAKCEFLTAPSPPFELVETLLLKEDFAFRAEHRERLARSAEFWGYPFVADDWERLLGAVRSAIPATETRHVRILLDEQGHLRWEGVPLGDSPADTPRPITLSRTPIDETQPLLYHKTTYRPWYREAGKRLTGDGLFDVLFINTQGQLTEGTRTNLFVRIDGRLYTPPVSNGLLPGILRAELLRTGRCEERVLWPADLADAEAIFCGNSVRGLVAVRLVDRPQAQSSPGSTRSVFD